MLSRALPLLLICGAATLAGCSGQSRSGSHEAPPESELVIVTPHRPEIQREFTEAFKKYDPRVKIVWKAQRGTGEALRFVQQGFASHPASGIGVDIFFGGGPETFLELEAKKQLQILPSEYGVPPELNGVPLRSYDKRWVAAALSRFGILYNRSIASQHHLPVPNSWAALGQPTLRDRVELVDPRTSGSARVIYESILQLYGWERGWQVLTSMAGNASSIVTSSSIPLEDVAKGRAVFAPSVNFLAQTAVEHSEATPGALKLGYVEPEDQQVITPDPIGILRGAPHPKLARAFVEFVMSDEGQKLWMLRRNTPGGPKTSNLYRLSVLPSLFEPLSPHSLVRSDPYAEQNVKLYDAQKAVQRHKVLEDLIGAVLIENHDLLRTQWKKNPNASRLTFVPVKEAQMSVLAKGWSDAKLRAATIAQWRSSAKQHYSGG